MASLPKVAQRARNCAWRVAPPLIAFVAVRVRLIQAAQYREVDATGAQAFVHWDANHYLGIAEVGYQLKDCVGAPGTDPADFCGNTGWLPGFPLLVRALASLHVERALAGTIVAGTFAFATLMLLWNAFFGPKPSVAGLLALALAAFFPGHVYEHAVFPISMCAFLQLLSLRLYIDERYAWAGPAGACAAFSYSSGLALAGVFGLQLLLTQRDQPYLVLLRHLLASAGVVALGFLAFLLQLQIEVGRWDAYFLVQHKYFAAVTPPWIVFLDYMRDAFVYAPQTQTLFVAVLALALLWAAARSPRRALDGLLAIFLLFYWLAPLTLNGAFSIYRAEAVLLPAVPLATKLPVPVLFALVLIATYLAAKMDVMFFAGFLV